MLIYLPYDCEIAWHPTGARLTRDEFDRAVLVSLFSSSGLGAKTNSPDTSWTDWYYYGHFGAMLC